MLKMDAYMLHALTSQTLPEYHEDPRAIQSSKWRKGEQVSTKMGHRTWRSGKVGT